MSLAELIGRGAGRVEEHAAFGARTTYRVGGTVRVLVTLASNDDLDALGPLMLASGLSLVALGNGSNLLVADGEHDVIGVRLVGSFLELRWRDEGSDVIVDAGAGLDLPVAARRLAKEGVVGFEWAVGVPGTFGGAAMMNAGGHGSDMAASVRNADVWRDGTRRRWSNDDLAFGYRTSALTSGTLVLGVTLQLAHGDAERAAQEIRDVVRWRREHQPGGANAGSAFRNPDGDVAGRLIELAGCRGLRVGSAHVSEKHANFLIADVDGTANDVFALLRTVQERVRANSGVELHSEHRFLGFDEAP